MGANEYTRLLAEMKTHGVKAKDLSELLGINRQALSFKLHGKRNARFSVEQAICIKEKFFSDIPIEILFSREPKESVIFETHKDGT